MFTIFFIIISLIIIIYLFTAAAIVYHLKKYGVEGDMTPKMTWLFIGVSITFIIGLIVLFWTTPWEQIIS